MTNVSRRTVAKGAAWSVPAVSILSSAPALAASQTGTPTDPITDIDCSAVTWSDTGLKSYDVSSGFQSADLATYGGSSAIGMGSYYSTNIGQLGPDAPADSNGSAITGFTITWGSTAIIRTAAGKTGTGTVGGGTQTAQVIGGPLQQHLDIQTGVPYKGLAKKAENYVISMSIPFTLTFLDGLSKVHTCSSGPDTQLYYNVCYPAGPDAFGNYPDSGYVGESGAQWTVSTGAPVDACA